MKTFLFIRSFIVFSFVILFISVGNINITAAFSISASPQLSSNTNLLPLPMQNTRVNTTAPMLEGTAGTPDYEPPINVFLILHIDPLGDLGQETFKPDQGMYTRTHDEIDWLMMEATRHNLHFSSLYNGWYPKWALEHNDLSQFTALLAAGHEIGSHTHQITYDPVTDTWVAHIEELSIFGRPNYDPNLARQAWSDASRFVEAVLEAIGATGQNKFMCSTALSLSDERNLMTEFGFTIAPGNRLEVGVNYLGHMPWNPWRAANSDEPGYEIAEDLSAPYISINHGAQIGESGSHSTEVTVPALQRQFLMLYAEWLARERTGAEDRVWSFGFIYHPNQGDKYNTDLVEFLDWLDTYFIGKQSSYGNTIARYAMISEIADEFYAWESAHPRTSSFNYVDGDPYPYTYATLPEMLNGTAYESHVDLGVGVSCFCFSKEDQPIYMLWSDMGDHAVDFSSEISGQLLVTDANGYESVYDAQSIPLKQEPLFVEPQHSNLSNALVYYLGFVTEEVTSAITEFDPDVLVRAFLMFYNSTDEWIADYEPRITQCQQDGRLFMVDLQAAVLAGSPGDIPHSPNDPAFEFPLEYIDNWQDYACLDPEGRTYGEQTGLTFAHACVNNPDYVQRMKEQIKIIVDSGADGLHIDELMTRYFLAMEGYCDSCMDGFRTYLANKYTPEQLSSLYDIEEIEQFDFRVRLAQKGNLQTPDRSELHPQWWLFQLTNLVQTGREITDFARSYASDQGRDFVINTNAFEPEHLPERTLEMIFTDFTSIGTGMTINLRREESFEAIHRLPPYYSYIPVYRMAQAVTPNRAVTLFIDHPGGTQLIEALPESKQEAIVRWMYAEAYASGAFFHLRFPGAYYSAPESKCLDVVQFIQDNAEIFRNSRHLSDVGVLFSYASEIWDYWVQASRTKPHHNLQWYGLCQALTDMSIQYDVIFAPDGNVIPNSLTLENLLQYNILFVPWTYSLRDEHVQLLEAYARTGKKLVIVGDFATCDEERNPRTTPVVSNFPSLGAIVIPDLDFETYLNDPQSDNALTILNTLTSLLPRKLVTVTNHNVTAQLNRTENTVYCHMINKKMEQSGFIPQYQFDVKITLPPGLNISGNNATYMSPDQPQGNLDLLPITYLDNFIVVTVPVIEIYDILGFTCIE